MAASIPDTAPPMTGELVDWAEEHADRVGVAADDEAGTYEVTVSFERESLLLAGVLGQEGNPGLWETASLAVWNGVEADAALGFPEQLPEPPIVVGDDATLTVQTVNGEIELTPGDDAADDGAADDGASGNDEIGDGETGGGGAASNADDGE